MKRAVLKDKNLVTDILSQSFKSNQSVNYIIKQDRKQIKRIVALMDYSFKICRLYGDVFISDDKAACALVLYPDRKKTTFKSILLDIKLIYTSLGINNIKKSIRREAKIKTIQSTEKMSYLWFIGVDPKHQNIGTGSTLLKEIIEFSKAKNRDIYLETSTIKNLPWYQKFGFQIYHEEDFGYKLYFLRKVI